ncbi:MAG: hypothetical protein ACTSRG_08195 [Candidatus Helarchaeota archaeon]
MSSIRETLQILKNVFTSTKKMKFFIFWSLIALFFQLINIFGSRDEYILNWGSFLYNLAISYMMIGKFTINSIINSIILSLTYVKLQTNAMVGTISILCCGLSTFLFWLVRERITEKVETWEVRPGIKFFLFGSIGAIWVEFLFWFFEKVFNTVGVAASPDFLWDLVGTMPWYCTMVALVWIIHKRYSYTLVEIAFLGGFYEFISPDGVMGAIFSGQFANLILLPAVIPMYVLVYSYILIPPTILNRKEIEMINSIHMDRESRKKFTYGLIPLIGLIPYLIILPLMMG